MPFWLADLTLTNSVAIPNGLSPLKWTSNVTEIRSLPSYSNVRRTTMRRRERRQRQSQQITHPSPVVCISSSEAQGNRDVCLFPTASVDNIHCPTGSLRILTLSCALPLVSRTQIGFHIGGDINGLSDFTNTTSGVRLTEIKSS